MPVSDTRDRSTCRENVQWVGLFREPGISAGYANICVELDYGIVASLYTHGLHRAAASERREINYANSGFQMMQEGVAMTIILFGLVIGVMMNYMAWVWILSERREARVNALRGEPHDESGVSTEDGI